MTGPGSASLHQILGAVPTASVMAVTAGFSSSEFRTCGWGVQVAASSPVSLFPLVFGVSSVTRACRHLATVISSVLGLCRTEPLTGLYGVSMVLPCTIGVGTLFTW